MSYRCTDDVTTWQDEVEWVTEVLSMLWRSLYASITEQRTEKYNFLFYSINTWNKCIPKDLLNFPVEFSAH